MGADEDTAADSGRYGGRRRLARLSTRGYISGDGRRVVGERVPAGGWASEAAGCELVYRNCLKLVTNG